MLTALRATCLLVWLLLALQYSFNALIRSVDQQLPPLQVQNSRAYSVFRTLASKLTSLPCKPDRTVKRSSMCSCSGDTAASMRNTIQVMSCGALPEKDFSLRTHLKVHTQHHVTGAHLQGRLQRYVSIIGCRQQATPNAGICRRASNAITSCKALF